MNIVITNNGDPAVDPEITITDNNGVVKTLAAGECIGLDPDLTYTVVKVV